jgi:hypothetical protein
MVDLAPLQLSSPGSIVSDPSRQVSAVVQESAAVAVEVQPNTVREGKPYEAALIRKWIDQSRVPSWLRSGWEQWKKDRDYLHTEVFDNANARHLTVNLAARAIQKKEQKVAPTNADVSVNHRRGVGSVADVRKDAIRAAKAKFDAIGMPPQAPVLMFAAEQAAQAYKDEMEAKERYCQTSEAIVKLLMDEAKTTTTGQLWAKQAMTVGPAWVKVGWQRDFGRDSLGRSRNDDTQDQIKLLGLRSAEYANGQFGQDDPRYAELIMLSEFARQVGKKVMDGAVEPGSLPFAQWKGIADTRDQEPVPPQWLPEPEVWQGAVVDTVRPEAMRWDWRIPFERWSETPWVMEQNLMDVDLCASQYGLTPAERDRLGTKDAQIPGQNTSANNTPSASSESADPNRGTFEDQVQQNQIVVWERWDKSLRRRCIFVEGLNRFLVDETPGLVAPGFFPYVPLAFDTFDGAHLPVSTVMFIRKIQNAINQRLTDAEESLWASMKRYIVKRGAFRDGEIEKLRGAMPHDTIEVESPDDIVKSMQEIAGDDWNPNKYSLDGLFRLFELVSGMSISELGVTGQADFATEAAIADAASKATNDRHSNIMAAALTNVATIILHYASTAMSEKVVKRLVGQAAYWPQAPTRMDLLRGLSITVSAAGSTEAAHAKAATQVKEAMSALGQVLQLRQMVIMQGGTFDIDPLTTSIFRTINLDRPVREVLSFQQTPQLAGPPGMPGQPGLPGQPQPGQPAPTAPPGVPAGA